MDFSRLWLIGERARKRIRLTREERKFVGEIVPAELLPLPSLPYPAKVRHPAGFSLSGAPVRTLTRSTLVLCAFWALGPKYDAKSGFYHRIAADLALGIMRANFHYGEPKGTFCCAQCTLIILPVLEAGALRWFDGQALADDVRRLVEKKQWRFSGTTNRPLLNWALGHG